MKRAIVISFIIVFFGLITIALSDTPIGGVSRTTINAWIDARLTALGIEVLTPDVDYLTPGTAATTYEPAITGAKVLPDGVTVTTQALDDITNKPASTLFVHGASSHQGINILDDPDFRSQVNDGTNAWATITTAEYGAAEFGTYGENNTAGARLVHNSKLYDYAFSNRKYPVKVGDTIRYWFKSEILTGYSDDQNRGVQIQATVYSKADVALQVLGAWSGVGTFDSFVETSGVWSVTENDAQYIIFQFYVYSSNAAGTGTGYLNAVKLFIDEPYYAKSGANIDITSLANGVTTTTQVPSDISAKLATMAASRAIASFRGYNLAPDPNFFLAANGVETWSTLTNATYGPGEFGAYGEQTGTTGVQFVHAGKQNDFIFSSVPIPLHYLDSIRIYIHGILSADYTDGANLGLQAYVQTYDSSNVAGDVFGLYTGVGTLASWFESSATNTITNTDTAYGIILLYISDATASGTGSAKVDQIIVERMNSNYATSGNNSNITQLSGVTVPLTEAQGGTNANNLISPRMRDTEGITLRTLSNSGTPAIHDTDNLSEMHRFWQFPSTPQTLTDFPDQTGDHSDWTAGDGFWLLANNASTIDCSDNANIECNCNVDFVGSASQEELLHVKYNGSKFVITNLNSCKDTPTSISVNTVQASLVGGTEITSTGSISVSGMNKVYWVSAAVTTSIPKYSDCIADTTNVPWIQFIIRDASETFEINPDNADKLNRSGTAQAAGVSITTDGAGVVVTCYGTPDADGSGTDGFLCKSDGTLAEGT